MTEGYLFAGNRDLLAGLRKAYPTNVSSTEPTRGLPLHIRNEVTGADGLKQLGYAELYFQEPVTEVLTYLAQDPTGKLRARDVYPQITRIPHYVRFDSNEMLLWPRRESEATLDDPNFTQSPGTPSWTICAYFGEALDRWAQAANNYADKLWRAAYLGVPRANVTDPLAATDFAKSPRTASLLAQAAGTLRCSIHAQFLASLPMAATLDDSGGDSSEYSISRVSRTRVNTTASLELLHKITSGKQPKEEPEVSGWTAAAIQDQISNVETARKNATKKFDGSEMGNVSDNVVANVIRLETAAKLRAEDQITIREKYRNQLVDYTGLDPFDQAYAELKTRTGKDVFVKAVEDKFNAFLSDPAASLNEASPSQMGLSALRVRQATLQAKVALAELAEIPQLIRSEQTRNSAVNSRITRAGWQVGALESAIEATRGVKSVSGVSQFLGGFFTTEYDIGAAVRAGLVLATAVRKADEQTDINDSNSDFVIKNLLIAVDTRTAAVAAAQAAIDIAVFELRQVFAKAKQIVEDNVFFFEQVEDLWYYDPTLAFKKERAEEEYAEEVAEYQIESYKLARMLELSWCESYSNPVKKTANNGAAAEALSIVSTSYDPFVNAESVFSTAKHTDVTKYVTALKTWESKLRNGATTKRGDPPAAPPFNLNIANSDGDRPISLRQDMLRLVDYKKLPNNTVVKVSDTDIAKNLAEFRALLIDAARRDSGNRTSGVFDFKRLRIEFSLQFNQRRKVLGVGETFLITGTENNQFWNHRLKKLGVRLAGNKVFPTATNFIPAVQIEWFGTLERVGFFNDSYYTKTRATLEYPVSLNYDAPDERGGAAPPFGTSINLVLGGANQRFDDPYTGASEGYLLQDVEWPFFSTQVILTIPATVGGGMQIEKIEDIEFFLYFEQGVPAAAYTWPSNF